MSIIRSRIPPHLVLAGLALVLIAVFFLGSCKRAEVPRIGILQDKPQEWADALKLGFTDGLLEQGFDIGRDVVVVARSGSGDPQALTTIAETFARGDYALIYTLGTQATQEAFNKTRTKPVVFGAVTDPVKAGLFAEDLKHPLGNVTGTQDLWPYPAQFDLIQKLLPSAERLGIVYNSSEINSQVSVAHIKEQARKRGLQVEERTVVTEAEVRLAVESILSRGIDLFFVPADNTAQTSSPTIIGLCETARIPVFTGIPGIVESGALATVGTNYYELGKINAQQVSGIIREGKQARDIPVAIADRGDVHVNLRAAERLGIMIPDEVVDMAAQVYR